MHVKQYPLNNYFILDFTVMQCSVNKIFHCISSDYLLAASVFSVWSTSVQKPLEPVV